MVAPYLETVAAGSAVGPALAREGADLEHASAAPLVVEGMAVVGAREGADLERAGAALADAIGPGGRPWPRHDRSVPDPQRVVADLRTLVRQSRAGTAAEPDDTRPGRFVGRVRALFRALVDARRRRHAPAAPSDPPPNEPAGAEPGLPAPAAAPPTGEPRPAAYMRHRLHTVCDAP